MKIQDGFPLDKKHAYDTSLHLKDAPLAQSFFAKQCTNELTEIFTTWQKFVQLCEVCPKYNVI